MATSSDTSAAYAFIPAGIACGFCVIATVCCVICIICCVKNEDEDDLATPAQAIVPTMQTTRPLSMIQPQYVTYSTPFNTLSYPIAQPYIPTHSVNPEIY